MTFLFSRTWRNDASYNWWCPKFDKVKVALMVLGKYVLKKISVKWFSTSSHEWKLQAEKWINSHQRMLSRMLQKRLLDKDSDWTSPKSLLPRYSILMWSIYSKNNIANNYFRMLFCGILDKMHSAPHPGVSILNLNSVYFLDLSLKRKQTGTYIFLLGSSTVH